MTPGSEAVIATLSTFLWSFPTAGHEALFLEVTKDGINRAVLPVEGAFGPREDALPDTVTIVQPIMEDIQNDQIVRARRQVSTELVRVS